MAENLNLHTIDTVDTSPFKKFVMTIGELPTSFLESMTYYEALAWFTNYLQNTIIPTVNNNAEAVEELQKLFTTLYNYVHDYFDNLDVQEEINHKLDEMVEDGTLQEIVADYLNSKAVFGFDTVADMKASTNLINGSYARTLGYYAKNDGGQGLFKIRTITNDDVVNETTIYEMENDNTLIAELIIDESMNVKQFGVKADGTTDNTAKLNTIIGLGRRNLYFPNGTYLINTRLNVNTVREITGQSNRDTIIKAPNGFIYWSGDGQLKDKIIKNLKITGDEITVDNIGIEGTLAFGKFEDLVIDHFHIAYKPTTGTWINNFDNICIMDCDNGIYNSSLSAFNDNTFVNCVFQRISGDCFNASGDVNNFTGCDFEGNGNCFNRVGRLLNAVGCYFEGNTHIVNMNSTSYQSHLSIKDSWMLAPSVEGTPSLGWIAILPSVTSVDTETASLEIIGCDIRNVAATNKPISFQGDGPKTYWSVSVENNNYYNIGTNYLVYYDDLFDNTNASQFATTASPTTYYADIPLYNYNGMVWFKKSLGNKHGALKTNSIYVLKGRYSVEQTAGLITITPDKRYGGVYPQISNMVVTVRFSDNTMTIARMSIDSSNYYIYVEYDGKTTAEVIFDNEYSNLYR